ncbi:MAG: isochorismatase family protein [bacterium]|nr:isochorismatase family protein [bacterium]
MDKNILLMIDIQEKLVNAVFNNECLTKKAEILSKASKILNIPVVITEQYPKGLGKTISEISNNIDLNSKIFEKSCFNALNEQDLYEYFKSLNTKNIILCGIETHICVYQTAKALIECGYSVTIVKDACGSRKEDEFLSALDNLRDIGCEIKTTEMVLFELLQSAKHPYFKEIQALIK